MVRLRYPVKFSNSKTFPEKKKIIKRIYDLESVENRNIAHAKISVCFGLEHNFGLKQVKKVRLNL